MAAAAETLLLTCSEHGVVNGGSDDRIHLIVDYVLAGEKIIDADGATLVC